MVNPPRMKTAAEGPQNQGADKADLEEQLSRIKSDIGELASTLKSIGVNRADERISDLSHAGEKALDDLRKQVRSVEDDLSGKVREKPLQTLGIAAGVGFLAAIILRR